MRPTLADYMRNNALKMESAELAPVTEIVAPVTIPDGVEERSRDHLILLPSPGVASSVQVGLGEGDAFEPLTEEQIGVSTVDGDATTASAIVVRDRKLAGELRIRYAPVNVAMEDGDKPFVQLGTVVEPGSENKNPYPANAPTEEAAPQVTNQPTIERDRGEMEDKAKIAENAVDQSVAPKVNVTVVEKGAETRQQDNNKVVDANDGNTGERKAEEVAKETELKGPKEEEETEDNAVNTNGEDPAKASAAVEQEQKNDDAAASTENGNDEGSEENTDAAEAEEEEEEELKQEGYDLTVLIDEAASPLVMEDAEAKTGIVTRVFEGLKKFINRIILWFKNTVLGGARKKRRKSAAEAAERLVQSLAKAKELRKEAIAEVERTYTVGIAKLSEYSKVMTMLAELATDGQKELEKISTDVFMQGTKGGVDTYLKQLEAWGKKYHTKDLFGPEFSSGMVTDSEKLEEEIRKAFKGDQASGLDRTKLDKAAKEIRDVLKPYTAKLNQFNGVSSITQQARASVIADNADTAEVRKVARYLTIAYNYVSAGIKIAQIMEDAMKNFVMAAKNTLAREIGKSDDVGRKLRSEGKAPILDENQEQEEELTQLSFQIEADLNVDSTGYVAEDADKKGFFARAWENLVKFINKVKTWLNDKVFSKFGKKKLEAELEQAKKLAAAMKAARDLRKESLDNLTKRYTAGIRDLKKYSVLMTQLSTLATEALPEADNLAKEGFMALNGNSGSVEKVDAVNVKFAAWEKKYNISAVFGDGDSAEAKCAALNKELRATFQSESGGSLDMTKLKAAAAEIQSVLLPYTEKLNHSQVGSTTSLKSTLAVSSAMNSGVTSEHARLLLKNISGSLAYIIGALTAAQIIETAMKNFVMAALDAIMRNGDDLKTEGFSQPVEIMSAPSDVAPIVIPADKPFLPESLVVTRVTNEDQLVILREDKVRVRTNEAGLGEAIVVVDPALQGQIQANYEAVVSGELPAMESDEDPVVTLDVITDDRDGVEIRVAQMVDGDTEEAIPEELVELRAEGAIALEAHENCIKGLSSMAYMVDMANSIQFEGDVQAAELVMEGMLDSIKGAMTRLGNWLDKSMKYQKVWDINWNQALAGVQKQIRNARNGTAKADVVKLNRVVRNLTINGAPVTDFRELQRQLAEIAKLGNDAKAHMVAVGNLYEDVRRLIAKHDNVNPDGAAILKEIPALVKKVNLRPWASLVKGERQVSEKSVERVPTSAPFLGDVVVAERQSLNDLTYANPDKALRAMLEKTYVGYRTDWELDRDLTSAEMSVLSPQDMEALLNSLRKASEAWDMYSTIVATGKKMDAFYRSLWSLKQYDRDFLSAYGVIIAADQWAYHPVLDLRFDLAYPMQAVLRLININCAVYK